MGHYSSSYEADDEKSRKEQRKKTKKLIEDIDKLEDLIDLDVSVPERFLDSLEDFKNWLKVRLNEI